MQKSWNATRSPFTATARVSRQQRSLPSHEVLARLNSCVLFCSTLKSMCIFLWIKIQLNVIDLNIMKPNSWIRLHTAAPFPWCLACAVVRFQVLHVSGTFWLVFGNWKPSAVQVQELIFFFKSEKFCCWRSLWQCASGQCSSLRVSIQPDSSCRCVQLHHRVSQFTWQPDKATFRRSASVNPSFVRLFNI